MTGTEAETISQQELLDRLTERFGPDPTDWAFVCPHCGDVATGGDFRAALADHPRTNRDGSPTTASGIMGQECIGRTLGALSGSADDWAGRGCDWCAYGLFGGPLGVVLPNGKVARSFHVAAAMDEATR